jgi:hypothetical protein
MTTSTCCVNTGTGQATTTMMVIFNWIDRLGIAGVKFSFCRIVHFTYSRLNEVANSTKNYCFSSIQSLAMGYIWYFAFLFYK